MVERDERDEGLRQPAGCLASGVLLKKISRQEVWDILESDVQDRVREYPVFVMVHFYKKSPHGWCTWCKRFWIIFGSPGRNFYKMLIGLKKYKNRSRSV